MSEPLTIWLELHPGCSIEVNREVAMRMTEREFAAIYRRHVYGKSRREAKRWAREQVAARAALAVGVEARPEAEAGGAAEPRPSGDEA